MLRTWTTPSRGLPPAFPKSPGTAELLQETLLLMGTHIVGGEPRRGRVLQAIPPEPEVYVCGQAVLIRASATTFWCALHQAKAVVVLSTPVALPLTRPQRRRPCTGRRKSQEEDLGAAGWRQGGAPPARVCWPRTLLGYARLPRTHQCIAWCAAEQAPRRRS